MKLIKKYIGDRAFYKMISAVALPIMFQNLITNLVSLLDNFMVGRLGTEQTSGVAIANQILFVFNLTIFGAISGPGVFTSQYYGKKDKKGIQYTIRFKFIIGVLLLALSVLLFLFKADWLIDKFIHQGDVECDIELLGVYAKEYFTIMIFGLLPFVFTEIFASTMRSTGDTLTPMVASFVAVAVNCILNYILIFGKLGVPESVTGVKGAAIATVVSRFIECTIVILGMYCRKSRFPYIKGAFSSLKIPKSIYPVMCRKSLPIMLNELFWSMGMTLLGVCYSYYGGSVVAGYSISSTVWNLFTIAFIAFGTAIGIVAGKYLGAKQFKEAEDAVNKMIAFSLFISIISGVIMYFFGAMVPKIYDVNEGAKEYAATFIRISGFFAPIEAMVHSSYYTVRSGGKTLATFLFDSFFTLCIASPVAFMIYFTMKPPVVTLYIILQSLNLIKCVIGLILVKKKIWIRDIV